VKAELIIFDCDGVLVDSERVANRVFCECLREIGINLTFEETVKIFKGKAEKDYYEIISRDFGKKITEPFVQTWRERFEASIEKELTVIPGIIEILDSISLPICIASNGPHSKMKKTLGVTGLLSRFEGSIFSVDDVSRGKPHPDIFLHAADVFKTNPASCIVVDDSVSGVIGAVSAGMKVFGFADLTEAEELKQAGAITFTEMKELKRLLSKIIF
jgi:HAD superfamily hydrolase (TIGR01509 family)